MRNLRHSEMRRSSAAGLSGASAQRPPLPPKIETRCHSYDGLLGDDSKKRTPEGRDSVDKGPTKDKGTPDEHPAGKAAPPEESIKAKNRRSRSMDDLFDDDGGHTAVADFLENTQSMENLSEPPPAPTSSPPLPPDSPVPAMGGGGGNICLNRRFVEPAPESRSSATASPESCYEEPCENEVITVDSTPRREDDAVSTSSSATSGTAGKKTTAGNNNPTSPFINKYVKKVKSLMKK